MGDAVLPVCDRCHREINPNDVHVFEGSGGEVIERTCPLCCPRCATPHPL